VFVVEVIDADCLPLTSISPDSLITIAFESGCINMSNQANLGLAKPMDALTGVVSRHAMNGVSRADIWALAATVGVDVTQNPNSRIDFPFNTWGRVNCEDRGSPCLDENGNSVTCSSTQGPHRNHPGVNMFTADLYNFFANEFGYTPTDTITIMGAHTIGVIAVEVRYLPSPHSRDIPART
jgi:hypothetical protein